MQNLYLYKNTNQNSLNLYKVTKSATPESNYVRVTSIFDIQMLLGVVGDYKTIRDCMKTRVEELGFDSMTAQEQMIAATNNIGTGAQIKAAIPDVLQRDASSAQYLQNMKGSDGGVRACRSIKLEALFWSRMKHINVDLGGGFIITAPELIYNMITITASAQGEMDGNLLILYEDAGIQGVAAGDKTLGIYDFIQETVGTRFESNGLRSNVLLASLVPDGYANMNDFADAAFDLLDVGFF